VRVLHARVYSARVAVQVLGTGVLIRLATDEEVRAVERARRGREFELEPPRSYRFQEPEWPVTKSEVYVVSQAFVDFVDDNAEERWTSAEHHGHQLSVIDDATKELLALADETAAEGLVDLLGDMGIAGLGVSRWTMMSAPRRIELALELEARLVPLHRR
jgi:hypothetical protein